MVIESSRVESVFSEALAIGDDSARADFLRTTCDHSSELRNRVETLLHAYNAAGEFLQAPLVEMALAANGLAAGVGDSTPHSSEDPPSFLSPPQNPAEGLGTLGLYAVIEEIGRGGMGVVLKARDLKLNRTVALKVLSPLLSANEGARQRFLREARAAASIKHDHVATIHAIDEDNGMPYIVMEHVEQGSLQHWLDRHGPLDPLDVARIALQIASGLSAAHENELVHRDIKPANILLENGLSRAKITDFGIAGACNTQSSAGGMVAGTPEYMSPEQAENRPLDHRSDLFSLGCLIHTLCVGRSPFAADTPAATLQNVCHKSPQSLAELRGEVPEWLDRAVSRLLEKEASRRYQSAATLAGFLRERLSTERFGNPDSQSVDTILNDKATGIADPSLAVTTQIPGAIDTDDRSVTASEVDSQGRRRRIRLAAAGISLACAAALIAFQFAKSPPAEELRGESEAKSVLPSVTYKTTEQKTAQVPVARAPEVEKKNRLEIDRIQVPGRATKLALANDEKTVYVASSDKSVYTFDLETGKPGVRFVGHRNPTLDIVLSPDNTRLATSGGDRTIRVWNVKTGLQTLNIPLPVSARFITFSSDGTQIIATLFGGRPPSHAKSRKPLLTDIRSIMAFDATTGRVTRRLAKDRKEHFWSIACSPTGKYIAAGSQDGSVLLIDATTGQELTRLSGHQGPTHSLKFSRDGKRLYTGANDGSVCCWDIPQGTRRFRWRFQSGILALDFNDDESLLFLTGTIDVRVCEFAEGERPRLASISGHTSPVSGLYCLSNGSRAVSSAWDGTVRIWSIPRPFAKSKTMTLTP